MALSLLVCPLVLGSACGTASPGNGASGGAAGAAGGGMSAAAGGGSGGAAGGTGGAAAGGSGGPGTSGQCPAALPTFDARCSAVDLTCTYGDSPRPSCRSIMTCGSIEMCNCGSDNCPPADCTKSPPAWLGGGPGTGVGYTDRCAWTCPATPPAVGDRCTTGYCPQSDGTQCGCIAFDSQGAPTWACLPPPSDARCPRVAPLIGSACSIEGLACGNYDLCVTGSRVLCKSGTWVDNFGSCPH
jgi:hypothetical protein